MRRVVIESHRATHKWREGGSVTEVVTEWSTLARRDAEPATFAGHNHAERALAAARMFCGPDVEVRVVEVDHGHLGTYWANMRGMSGEERLATALRLCRVRPGRGRPPIEVAKPHIVARLGINTDGALAAAAGVRRKTIAAARQRLGIPGKPRGRQRKED